MMIALPIMLQNGITNFVNMLDNIMVGRVGTDPMTGVSIVNSLLFVWNLCVFGGLSGIGIFIAQYCGKRDDEGVRRMFRLQIILSVLLVLAGLLIFAFYGSDLIGLYLHEDGGGGSVEATMHAALGYLTVMCIGFLPFAITQAYDTTIRSHGETVAPMVASFLAVAVNLVGNYILIFGKCGVPALGVLGAAAATVVARFVELFYIVLWAHAHKEKLHFIEGAYIKAADMVDVLTVRIGQDVYQNAAGEMLKVLSKSEKSLVLEAQEIDYAALNETGGAYGSSSTTIGTTALSSLEGIGGTNSSANINHMELKMNKESGKALTLISQKFLFVKGQKIKASKRDFMDVPGLDREYAKTFLKQNKIKWNKVQDLQKAGDFLAEILK